MKTVLDVLSWGEAQFLEANLYYGHGTDNAWDDMVALACHVLDLPPDVSDEVGQRVLTQEEKSMLLHLVQERIDKRKPVPYLTQHTWFAGLSLYVDERVMIPRSPIAELILARFAPWLPQDKPVLSILDLCTGSGCIALACARAFPDAVVDAVDLSENALKVAAMNVERHHLKDRVNLIHSDLFEGIQGKKYDLIVSNPPYVAQKESAALPEEYRHEPEMAFFSGEQGLDCVTLIIQQAYAHLKPGGMLVVEVGDKGPMLERHFPDCAFVWPEFEQGGEGVFLLHAEELL